MPKTVIDELVTIIGVDVNTPSFSNIKRMQEGLGGIVNFANKLTMALVGATAAAAALQLNKSSAELSKLSELTGLSTKSLQEWGYAAEQVGGNFDTVIADLQAMTKAMSSPIPGEFNQALFLLGISALDASGKLKTADQIFLEIADKLRGMNPQEQMQWAAKLGLSNDTLLILRRGRGEIEQLFRQAQSDHAIIPQKDLEAAREFVEDLNRLRRILLVIAAEMASKVEPEFHKLIDLLDNWHNKHEDIFGEGMLSKLSYLKNLLLDLVETFGMLGEVMDKISSGDFTGAAEIVKKWWNSPTHLPERKEQQESPEAKEERWNKNLWDMIDERERPAAMEAMKYFVSQGMTPDQAAGVVANLKAESGLNPKAVGDHGTAFGIAQWRGDRLKALAAFAKSRDQSMFDYQTQLDFIMSELYGSEYGAYQDLMGTTTAREAARAFSRSYERPNPQYANEEGRMRMAEITINNYVSGGNAEITASRITAKVQSSLQQLFSGNLAPTVQ